MKRSDIERPKKTGMVESRYRPDSKAVGRLRDIQDDEALLRMVEDGTDESSTPAILQRVGE